MPSICVVAGDPSGDAHAAGLVEALSRRVSGLTVAGLGGPALRRAGATLFDDLTLAAAIGPFDAARHLSRFLQAKRLLETHLRTHRPDLVVLVDFGDFNLPVVAPLAKRYGIPVVYFISPQLWAWGRWRLRYVQRYVDRMLVLFRFEEEFYRRHGVAVTWVGHPLKDQARPTLSVQEAATQIGLNPWRRTVGLLPGSREREVARHLPLLLATARHIAWQMPGIEFIVPRASSIPPQWLTRYLQQSSCSIHIAEGPMPNALQLMQAAIVASGTATLEAALCAVPMAVVYRTSWLTYLGARLVVRIPHIAMVNVMAQRRIVPEFVQHRVHPKRLAAAIIELLRDEERGERMRRDLREVSEQLGPPGAIDRAASALLDVLNSTHRAGSPRPGQD